MFSFVPALIATSAAYLSGRTAASDVTQSADEQKQAIRGNSPLATTQPSKQHQLSPLSPSDRKKQIRLYRTLGYGSMFPHCKSIDDIIRELYSIIDTQDLNDHAKKQHFHDKLLELYTKTQPFSFFIAEPSNDICRAHRYELCKMLNNVVEIAKTKIKDKSTCEEIDIHNSFMVDLCKLQDRLQQSVDDIPAEMLSSQEKTERREYLGPSKRRQSKSKSILWQQPPLDEKKHQPDREAPTSILLLKKHLEAPMSALETQKAILDIFKLALTDDNIIRNKAHLNDLSSLTSPFMEKALREGVSAENCKQLLEIHNNILTIQQKASLTSQRLVVL